MTSLTDRLPLLVSKHLSHPHGIACSIKAPIAAFAARVGREDEGVAAHIERSMWCEDIVI